MISTKGRYALRMLTDLAQHTEEGYLSLREIAARQEISLKYLESIAAVLTRGGLLQSQRGKDGGYRLTDVPEKLSVGGILRCVEENLAPVSCIKEGSVSCERAGMCRTLPMWMELDNITNTYLDNITLSDLLTGKKWK